MMTQWLEYGIITRNNNAVGWISILVCLTVNDDTVILSQVFW